MHLLVEAITPLGGLLIQVVKVGEVDPRPEVVFAHPDTALDFPFRLWRVRLAHSWRDTDRGHEIGKAWMPDRLFAIHIQQHRFHPIG